MQVKKGKARLDKNNAVFPPRAAVKQIKGESERPWPCLRQLLPAKLNRRKRNERSGGAER